MPEQNPSELRDAYLEANARMWSGEVIASKLVGPEVKQAEVLDNIPAEVAA